MAEKPEYHRPVGGPRRRPRKNFESSTLPVEIAHFVLGPLDGQSRPIETGQKEVESDQYLNTYEQFVFTAGLERFDVWSPKGATPEMIFRHLMEQNVKINEPPRPVYSPAFERAHPIVPII